MDIRKAAKDTSNILPEQLKGYCAKERTDGDGVYVSKGGFALCIKLEKTGCKPKCLRFWRKIDESQIDYLEEVENIIKGIKRSHDECSQYFIDFSIEEKLLKVNKVELPGLLMDWIEGETLRDYVMANSDHNSSEIKEIAYRFAEMCNVFNKRRICHGDLSAVNIIVCSDGSLKVIDYDSLYTPSMGRKRQFISGTRDYQHPKRKSAVYYEEYTDYFSQHLIYTALLIMAYDAKTRTTMKVKNLLFEDKDLTSPSTFRTSDIVVNARKLNANEINSELNIIEKALGGDFEDVPPLDISGRFSKKSPTANTSTTPTIRKVFYCTSCGKKYASEAFDYCTACGTKRLTYK